MALFHREKLFDFGVHLQEYRVQFNSKVRAHLKGDFEKTPFRQRDLNPQLSGFFCPATPSQQGFAFLQR